MNHNQKDFNQCIFQYIEKYLENQCVYFNDFIVPCFEKQFIYIHFNSVLLGNIVPLSFKMIFEHF